MPEHNSEEELVDIFSSEGDFLMDDVDHHYLSSLAAAQDSFRLATSILRAVGSMTPQEDVEYAEVDEEVYRLSSSNLLAEPVAQEEEGLVTLWDLLSEDP